METTQQAVVETGVEHSKMAISLIPDILFHIGPLPISNAFLASIFLSIILIFFILYISFSTKLVPSKIQMLFEAALEGGYNYTKDALDGNEKVAKKVFPFIASFFIIILFFNLAKFIPGMESIKFGDLHLFKPVHSDLNMTLALSIVAFTLIQIMGVFVLGFFRYAGKFINIKKPQKILLGLMELISEIAKLFSLSFRLFVNIFVGGVLIVLLSQISHFLAPVPVMFFEIFVAFLQAGVFSLLTLFYIKIAISEPH